jgi:putative transposase
MTASGGEELASRFYREAEEKLAMLQRRGHKQQSKFLNKKVKHKREDARNKFTREIVDNYQYIFIGNASSQKLAKTRMAKSVLDAAWGASKLALHDRGHRAGRAVFTIDERNTTKACSCCGALTGPTGQDMLDARQWTCSSCGATHERDINAGANIEMRGWQLAASQANLEGRSLFATPCPRLRPGMGVR